MEITAHVDTYPLPPMSAIVRLILYSQGDPASHPGSVDLLLQSVTPAGMQRLRQTPQEGTPAYWVHERCPPDTETLVLYPCPDRDTVAEVLYYPPLERY